jgi:hypothetical protein
MPQAQIHLASANGVRISLARRRNHQLGGINAGDQSAPRSGGENANRLPCTEPDLDDPIGFRHGQSVGREAMRSAIEQIH